MKSCGMDPPQDWKIFEFISEFSIKSCWMEPPIWHLGEILEILLFQVQSIDACKFAINLFPISWGPFEDVNLLYFLLKMQIWNGCNVLNITRNPIKDINVNLSFPSSRWKVVEWTPLDWKIFEFISEFSIKCCWMEPPRLENFLNAFLSLGSEVVEWTPQSDIWWKIHLLHVLYNDAWKFAIFRGADKIGGWKTFYLRG